MTDTDNLIVVDSCTDYDDISADGIERVPFVINIDECEFIDSNLNISDLLMTMKKRKSKILTACPSPGQFIQSFRENANSFVVTISSKLSGSYNSAVIAKDMFLENCRNNKLIHVFDSKSASVGQNMIVLKLKELIEKKLSFQAVVDETEKYIANLKTFFIIDSLDHLAKSGRISQMSAFIGSALHITPIMGENGDGEIVLKAKAHGIKGAYKKLAELISSYGLDYKDTVLGITHVDALEKAVALKDEILGRCSFKSVKIFKAGGISSAYADKGGLVIAFSAG